MTGQSEEDDNYSMIFQRETLSPELIEEMMPLLKAHHEEMDSILPLDPDFARFQFLQDCGALAVFTMREAQDLVGYWVCIVNHAIHSKNVLIAYSDAIYVKPEARGLEPIKFIKFVVAELKKQGVKVFDCLIKTQHNFGVILERMGFKQEEQAFTLRLT